MRKKKISNPMFAMIVMHNGHRMRSGFKFDRDEAIQYAERMPGVIEIEEIGVGVIWIREIDFKEE